MESGMSSSFEHSSSSASKAALSSFDGFTQSFAASLALVTSKVVNVSALISTTPKTKRGHFWSKHKTKEIEKPKSQQVMEALQLSDAFESHPLYLHQDHPDDFSSLHELPNQYKWAQINEYPSLDSSFIEESVPIIIDLKDPNALQLIGHACKSWGIFQVTNHGVPQKLIDDIEYATRCLFTLPMEQKLKVARPPTGISGYGFHRISAFCEKLMWSEGFTIVGSPLDHFRQLWPEDYNKFCTLYEEYEKEMKNLAERLMWLMLGSLGILKEDIKWANPNSELELASAALQLNSYPACPTPDRAMGLVDHTDSNLLSIIHQGNISGLQALREEKWITVPPIPGALVINVGDLIHILSNGLYHNVFHRAVVNRTHHRVSVAYRYGPPISAEISPLSKLVGEGHPPLYRQVTWKEYLGIKAKLNNKTILSIHLDGASPK